MDNTNSKTAAELKDEGNKCVKEGKFAEAILHYSQALQKEPDNFTLYSNRSLAFLKVQQYNLAMEDAISTIKMQKDWAKGYFRKAEVELATGQYPEAFLSYQKALHLQPDDSYVSECLRRTGNIIRQERRADEQYPWVGAGIGLVIGVIIVIAELLLTPNPTLNHPLLMVLLTVVIAMCGYGIAKVYRWYTKLQRSSLIEPTGDQSDQSRANNSTADESEEASSSNEKTPRYTKAQARQRFKKGKM